MRGSAAPTRRIAIFLFGSGLCALVYQLAWLREFRLIFGASTAASAAVLAIFMAGLGAGGLLLGGRVDRSANPLRFYAKLELAIASFTVATPLLLALVRRIYLAVGGSGSLGAIGGTGFRLALAALVLCLPTLLMGGTLPAAARAVESDADRGRRGVGLLYGANTLGAVAGCLLATFYSLEAIGTHRTLWLATGINLMVGGLAWWLSSRQPLDAALNPDPDPDPNPDPDPDPERGQVRTPAPAWLILGGAAVVGFAFFLMEMVWYRMLGPLLGGTVYTFGLILAIALLGIGAGGWWYAARFRARVPTIAGFALTCLLEAVALMVPFAIGDPIAILADQLRSLGGFGFAGHVAGWAMVGMVVMLPAALLAGFQFPMLIALLGRGRVRVGRQVGMTYAWNTIGAIAGSLAGGFGLLPALSAQGCWRLVAVVLCALGAVTIVVALYVGSEPSAEPGRGPAERRWPTLVAPALALIVAIALTFTTGPTSAWRHSGIGAGRADIGASANEIHAWLNAERRDVVWQVDGVESSVALVARDGYAFIVNGKSDGNARSDAPTMVMSGVLPALLHPAPHRALVIGLGTGATAGWLGAVPEIEAVDVVELERAVLDVAAACAAVNEAVLDNPKVTTRIGDGREVLLTSDRRYDLIVSEPSNPYRAGVASLFTVEFYRAVERRLAPGGLFVQWVQGYEVDAQTLRTVIATVTAVFPHVETWQLHAGDLALVASREPIDYDVARLRARIATPPFDRALASVWRATSLEELLGRFVADSRMARAVARAEADRLNRDDHNRVEFDFARTVGRTGRYLLPELREAAHELGAARPAVYHGEIDWGRVAEAEVDTHFASGMRSRRGYLDASQRARFTPDQRSRAAAKAHFVGGRYLAARRAWEDQAEPPRSLAELEVVAGVLAELGDPQALDYLALLRSHQPVEADALLAAWCFRTHDLDGATAALEQSLSALRDDPWPLKSIMSAALDLAEDVARTDPSRADRLYQAVATPFAVRVLETQRQRAAAAISVMGTDPGRCLTAMAAFEPYPRWTEADLLARAECYEINRHPRAEQAWRDLSAYLAAAPTHFGTGLR